MSADVILDIQADNKKALTAIDKINKRLKITEKQGEKNNTVFSKMGKILGGIAIGAGIVAVTKHSIELGRQLQETENKLNAVFGAKGQASINTFAKNYAKDMGVSILQTKKFIGDAGNLFNGFGMGEDQARKFSTEVLKLTNDLASFNNMSTEDAQRKMMSALMGESESAKGLGASILEDQMKRASLALGLGEYSNKMDELTKIQIRYKAILMQSQKAVGDMARSQGSLTSESQRLATVIEMVSMNIGAKLAPILASIIGGITSFIMVLQENADMLVSVATGIGVAVTALGLYHAWTLRTVIATKAVTLAQNLWNIAMKANPIGLIVTAIGALVGYLVHLYNVNEKVRYGFVYAWESMKAGIASFVNFFIDKINTMIQGFNAVKGLFGGDAMSLIQKLEVKSGSDIDAIAKAKSLIVDDIKIPKGSVGGNPNVPSTTTSNDYKFDGSAPTVSGGSSGGGSSKKKTGSKKSGGSSSKSSANCEDTGSYYQTFGVGGSTKRGQNGGKMDVGGITINITKKDGETDDKLIDRLQKRIANEIQKSAKIAGII